MKTPVKRRPTDSTIRNVRAANKRIDATNRALNALTRRVLRLEWAAGRQKAG